MIGALLIQMGIMAGLMWDESYSDFVDIEDNKPINHSAGFKRRVGVALITAAMISLFVATGMDELDWSLLKIFGGLCLVSYGFFTPVFRWRLNRLRGMDARYISPSNWYDRLCMLPFVAPGVSMLDAENWTLYHRASYVKVDRYTKHVHRSGLTAYAVEMIALIAGVLITLKH